jgi:hypothetical protein
MKRPPYRQRFYLCLSYINKKLYFKLPLLT